MVSKLTLEFNILTPLFMAGALPSSAELRAPSFKGLLRFWYRAIDPSYNEVITKGKVTREEYFFGGSSKNAGQSQFILRIQESGLIKKPFSAYRHSRFDEGHGKNRKNGFLYLGYPFNLKRKSGIRQSLAPQQTFTIQCIIPRAAADVDFRRVLLASCWLLGHLGSAGSRNRRGFGGLALTGWKSEPNPWPELSELPLLIHSKNQNIWASGMNQALETFDKWFGPFRQHVPNPHIGSEFRALLLPKRFPADQWDAALNFAGRKIQDFRRLKEPDYTNVKSHLKARKQEDGQFLQRAPDRATFGLPLSFRFPSLVRGGVAEFQPYDNRNKTTFERQGSLLFIRLAALADGLHPLFLRLDGDIPAIQPPAAIKWQKRSLRPPAENAMDQFMDHISRGNQ